MGLIKNHLNEMGIRMGFLPLIEERRIKMWMYMRKINELIEIRLGKGIFNEIMIDNLKKFEQVLEKNNDTIPINNLPELVSLYYDLRKIEAPNFLNSRSELFQGKEAESLLLLESLTQSQNKPTLFSFKKERIDVVKNLLLREIRQKELRIQKSLDQCYDKKNFETLYQLKTYEENLINSNKQRIKSSEKISSNSLYKRSTSEIPGYFLLGTSIVSLLFFVLLLFQIVLHPEISGALNGMSVLFFILAVFTFLIYWLMYLKEGHA